MPFLRSILVVVVASVALIAAGCGGDTAEKNEYVDQVNKAQSDFAGQVTKLSSAITAPSADTANPKTVASIRSYRDAVDGVVKDLQGIAPPEDVKAEHQQLVDAMSQYGKSVGAALDDLQGGTAQDRLKAAQQLQQASTQAGTQINQAIDAINTKLQE